ncbi:MAG: primase-helicase zinc-binding domain-containing protein [Desulfobulbia bacterium]
MNVLELYKEAGFDPHRAGDEWQGPCPECGGTDRFCVKEDANHKDGMARGWYHCGHGKGGNGCGKSGDNIQYLRDFHGMGYKEACDRLGITPENMQSDTHRYSSPRLPRKQGQQSSHTPKSWEHPPEVVDVPTWRQHGMKFVEACHEALLKRQKSLDWLAARGIPLEMVVKYKLGLHIGKKSKGEEWGPDFRPWPSWGLRTDKKEGGRSRMIILPAGIVVPWITNGELHRIRIRLAKPNPDNPKEKYHIVKGSSIDLFHTGNLKAKAFVLVETELDAIMIDSEAGDLITAVGLGTVGIKPDTVVNQPLHRAVRILNALDSDEAGRAATVWWEEQFKNSIRWPSPKPAKDAGEAWQHGENIRAWLMAGLPQSLHGQAAPEQEKAYAARRAAQQSFVPTGEIAELLALLTESQGIISISENGHNHSVNTGNDWRTDNPGKASRLSELVFQSVEAATYLSTLKDGIYTAKNLIRRGA